MAHEGQLIAGRYRLARVVGEGGMAVVYEADDERLGRRVAVKVLRPGFTSDPGFVARFVHEARAAASLADPNIITIHDAGSDGDVQFIVMELVEGPSLADVLAEHGALAPDRAASIAAMVADGLAAAHRRGIVHRDVKPGNILLDRHGRALIGDFGIARAFASTALTTTGTILGSVPYLSPEQATGGEVTAASDIYSLGVVLFEMLTGRRPFEASNSAAAIVRRLHEPPPEPSSIDPSLPPAIDQLVVRAMARAPADRYPSARTFAQALEAWRRRWARVQSLTAAGPISGVGAKQAEDADDAAEAATIAAAAESGDTVLMPAAVDRPLPPAAVASLEAAPPGSPPSSVPRSRHGWPSLRRVAVGPAMAVLGLAAILVLASMAALGSTNGAPSAPPSEEAVLAATARPSIEPSAVVAAVPSPSASAAPMPTATPTPAASATRTPRPNPPTPGATRTPAPTPRATAPPVVAVGPSAQVVRFYDAVAAHAFARAAALWSPSMRQRYPPATYIDHRFANTTGFQIRRASTTSQSGDRAVVAVDIVERRSTSPTTEHWVGSWSLVRQDGTWLLDDPDLAAAA